MKGRYVQLLLIAAVVQAVLIAAVYWPRGGSVEGGGDPLLPGVREKVARVTIEDGDGNRLTFANEGGRWTLPDADDFPLADGKAGEFLDKVAKIAKRRAVARTRQSHKALKVADDDFERKVEIESDGKRSTLYIGSSAGTRSSHARLEGEDETYIAADLSSWQAGTDMASWIDAEYFKVDKESIASVTLRNDQGELAFEKAGGGLDDARFCAPASGSTTRRCPRC